MRFQLLAVLFTLLFSSLVRAQLPTYGPTTPLRYVVELPDGRVLAAWEPGAGEGFTLKSGIGTIRNVREAAMHLDERRSSAVESRSTRELVNVFKVMEISVDGQRSFNFFQIAEMVRNGQVTGVFQLPRLPDKRVSILDFTVGKYRNLPRLKLIPTHVPPRFHPYPRAREVILEGKFNDGSGRFVYLEEGKNDSPDMYVGTPNRMVHLPKKYATTYGSQYTSADAIGNRYSVDAPRNQYEEYHLVGGKSFGKLTVQDPEGVVLAEHEFTLTDPEEYKEGVSHFREKLGIRASEPMRVVYKGPLRDGSGRVLYIEAPPSHWPREGRCYVGEPMDMGLLDLHLTFSLPDPSLLSYSRMDAHGRYVFIRLDLEEIEAYVANPKAWVQSHTDPLPAAYLIYDGQHIPLELSDMSKYAGENGAELARAELGISHEGGTAVTDVARFGGIIDRRAARELRRSPDALAEAKRTTGSERGRLGWLERVRRIAADVVKRGDL